MAQISMLSPVDFFGSILKGPSGAFYKITSGETITVDAQDQSFLLNLGFVAAPPPIPPAVVPQLLQSVTVALTSAQILVATPTPILIVPAPGANKMNVVQSVLYEYIAGVTPYTGGAGGLFYGSSTAAADGGDGSICANAASAIQPQFASGSSFDLPDVTNAALNYTTANGGDYVSCNGIMKITVYYIVQNL